MVAQSSERDASYMRNNLRNDLERRRRGRRITIAITASIAFLSVSGGVAHAAYTQLFWAPAQVFCNGGTTWSPAYGTVRHFRTRMVNDTNNTYTYMVGYIHGTNAYVQDTEVVSPGEWSRELSGVFSATNGDKAYVYVFEGASGTQAYTNAQVAGWATC